jgi:aryl carrier-like protein
LINETGIYVHKLRRGFHNYALPYSWDVRLGHKTRTETIEELNDDIDVAASLRVLQEIGYHDEELAQAGADVEKRLVAYYVTGSESPIASSSARAASTGSESPIASSSETSSTSGSETQSVFGSAHESASDLRAYLQERLPSAMVPTHFVQLDRLPLTINGKVDRRALPHPGGARSLPAGHGPPPRTPQEAALARIWAEVLGLAEVGIHDNFIELGGDSILNIQVVARAKAAGLVLTPRQVFDHPTIAELAAVAPSRTPGDSTAKLSGLADPSLSREELDRVLDEFEE